jgi:hypothetical protein
VTSSTIETVFSVGSVESACKRNECSDRISSKGSYELVVATEAREQASSKLEEYKGVQDISL